MAKKKPGVQEYRAQLREQARYMYSELNMSGPEIADKLQVHKRTVYGYLHRYPSVIKQRGATVKLRGGLERVPHDDIKKTCFLYEAPPRGLGWSTSEIADALGLTHSAVINRLIKAGVTMRSRSESYRLRLARRQRARPGTGIPRDKKAA